MAVRLSIFAFFLFCLLLFFVFRAVQCTQILAESQQVSVCMSLKIVLVYACCREFVNCVRCIKILSPQEVQQMSLDGDFGGSGALPNQACSSSDGGNA